MAHHTAPSLEEPAHKKPRSMLNSEEEEEESEDNNIIIDGVQEGPLDSQEDVDGNSTADALACMDVSDGVGSNTQYDEYESNVVSKYDAGALAPSDEEIQSFFLNEPVTEEERGLVNVHLKQNVEAVLSRLERQGAAVVFSEYVQSKKEMEAEERQRKVAEDKRYDESAVFKGIPRSYQIKLMNRAVEQNTIVHLGTGMGKTLIAVLLIRRMAGLDEEENKQDEAKQKDENRTIPSSGGNGGGGGSEEAHKSDTARDDGDGGIEIPQLQSHGEGSAATNTSGGSTETSRDKEDVKMAGSDVENQASSSERNEHSTPQKEKQKKNQVVFLVPSVALVLQQTSTLKANIPLTIGTAFSATVNSESSRKQLAQCELLVATHGAYLDLLLHFGDLFALQQVQLLILDECHNCVKNSPYATLMKEFYHALPRESRPRVLGLTASPLINIKKNCGFAELALKLQELESILDARVVPLTDLGLDQEDIPAFLRKDAQEEIVTFQSNRFTCQTNPNETSWSEYLAKSGLNRSREKEFRQVQSLYDDMGPHVTRLFCQQLQQSITRNLYEQETREQFHRANQFLQQVVAHCEHLCRCRPEAKFTPKLQALHALLNQQLDLRPDAVGLVFVRRRVTALALHGHFQQLLAERRRRQEQQQQQGVEFVGAKAAPKDNRFSDSPVQKQVSVAAQHEEQDQQFADADDDDEIMHEEAQHPVVPPSSSVVSKPMMHEEATTDQFDDAAEDDPFEIFTRAKSSHVSSSTQTSGPNAASFRHSAACTDDDVIRVDVKSGALVRKPSSMFRVLRKSDVKSVPQDGSQKQKGDTRQEKRAAAAAAAAAALSLREHETSIREVLNSLRRREINLLIATSVVEEGVDVQACSFVVVFDALTSLKAFIQMKGRARQKDASFFVFEEDDVEGEIMPLGTVKNVEARVNQFLASRDSSSGHYHDGPHLLSDDGSVFGPSIPTREEGEIEETCEELQALEEGQFRTASGTVTLRGAKSLLHRYALMQPMDPAVRSSRASMQAHLPSFDFESNRLSIPSHLGTYEDIRMVSLPPRYLDRTKKERESLVSLQACVRLHRHGLLNDRLLPLSERDIQHRFVDASNSSACREATVDVMKPVWSDLSLTRTLNLYLHRIIQVGETLDGYLKELNPAGRQLGILSWKPIDEIPEYGYSTGQLGTMINKLGEGVPVTCSSTEVETVSKFFDLIWNARWKRRTKDNHFRCNPASSSYFVYRVVSLNNEGNLDWEHMNQLIEESERTRDERIDSVRNIDLKNPLPCPRLWCPRYDENATYLVYGPSGDTCDAEFPHDHQDERIKTYKNYYEYQHQCKVPGDSILFDAARQWQLPRRAWSDPHEEIDDFKRVKLAHRACMEPVMSDAGMSLLTVLLPQFLHHVELVVSLQKFLEHVMVNVPDLARLLAKIPGHKLLDAITAKSCNSTGCYEKLEWLGDGVLKLVQTDALINSTELGSWIRHLPEGYLNSARSFMGSNGNLTAACKKLKLESFIHIESLSRGLWTPSPMELVDQKNRPVKRHVTADGKVCADVLESLIGLVYLEFGYHESMVASDALQLTIPHKDDELLKCAKEHAENRNAGKLIAAAEAFTGYRPFVRKSLVEEALTHPTKLSTSTSYSSYQRLEWIGDAVLCLAMRSWIYKNLPDMELCNMVLLEATLVCNETLAFLAISAGLNLHLLHGDQTLPSRIESYEWAVKEQGRGLWGTDPPKALADIVESLLGAVYIDGGFQAGQEAVYHAFRTILLSVKSASDAELERYCFHPKRNILSELGCLVSVDQVKEEELSESSPKPNIWSGENWQTPHDNGCQPVSILKCVGVPVLAVSDTIFSSAVNRVCAFVLTFLFDNKEYLQRFRKLKGDIQRSLTGKGTTMNEEDQDGDYL